MQKKQQRNYKSLIHTVKWLRDISRLSIFHGVNASKFTTAVILPWHYVADALRLIWQKLVWNFKASLYNVHCSYTQTDKPFFGYFDEYEYKLYYSIHNCLAKNT